jgi:hypothetical protein
VLSAVPSSPRAHCNKPCSTARRHHGHGSLCCANIDCNAVHVSDPVRSLCWVVTAPQQQTFSRVVKLRWRQLACSCRSRPVPPAQYQLFLSPEKGNPTMPASPIRSLLSIRKPPHLLLTASLTTPAQKPMPAERSKRLCRLSGTGIKLLRVLYCGTVRSVWCAGARSGRRAGGRGGRRAGRQHEEESVLVMSV